MNYSHIKVNDYTQGDCPKLESYFRMWNASYHRSEYHHIKFDVENRALYLPRGMDIIVIERLLNSKAHYNDKPSPYAINSAIGMKFPPRDAKQSETIKF